MLLNKPLSTNDRRGLPKYFILPFFICSSCVLNDGNYILRFMANSITESMAAI